MKEVCLLIYISVFLHTCRTTNVSNTKLIDTSWIGKTGKEDSMKGVCFIIYMSVLLHSLRTTNVSNTKLIDTNWIGKEETTKEVCFFNIFKYITTVTIDEATTKEW